MKRWLIPLCLGALLLAACGSGQSDEVEGAVEVLQQAEPLASPLERQLGFPSELGQREFELIELQQEADAVMVACMQDAGFFYAVARAGNQLQSGASIGDGSRAWVEINGLGITRSLIKALAGDAALGAVDSAGPANQQYVASLTAEQATAYDIALVGDVVPDPSGQFEPAGCWGSAYTRIVRIVTLIDEFDDELVTLNSRLNSDPRFLAFQAQWSGCMDGLGFRYSSENALVDDVYARLLDIDLVEVEGVTRATSASALDELLQFELQVAEASFDCRAAFADDVQRLRSDYEQEFLDDNRFRLAEFAEP